MERALLIALLIGCCTGSVTADCTESCNEIWSNGVLNNETVFYKYHKKKHNDSLYIAHWQWNLNTTWKWTLYYKEWPFKGIKTGGFLLTTNKKQTALKLDWKLYGDYLTWVSSYRQHIQDHWNATLCKIHLPVKLESNPKTWKFHLGTILLHQNKSGKLQLNGSTLLLFEEGLSSLNRKTRETEDLDEEEKKTAWNKIKGYFIELFDKGDDDKRGWLTRIGEWLMGFLQRALS